MTRSEKGRALFYTRDSGGKHEMTPAQYVVWACNKSKDMGLSFGGMPETINGMIAAGQSHQGDVFLDFDVAGNQLVRHGLKRLLAEVADDQTVSHVLIPRRDRFARPDDPLDAMMLEASISRFGVTIVFMDRTVPPLARGQRQDIGDMIVSLIDYHHAGKDRQELARKILFAQLALAQAGYSIGGRPPYGFCRWLVRGNGTLVRCLEDGERVRMRGHHVVWMPLPDDHPSMVIIHRILEMLDTMPASRVAAALTSEGIPSPDAGRWRKDNCVSHPVSGIWHQPTVINIARNPLLQALCCSGRRSMGDQLRHTSDGPRLLNDGDFRPDGKPKGTRNPDTSVVVATARFSPLVDPDRHAGLLVKLNDRAGTQRGKPRSRDSSMNPLGGRIYDMNCSWPLYRTPYNGSFRYSCGAYMQSHGAKCAHNHVDGPTATKFALSCLVQKLLTPQLLPKLQARLQQLASQEPGGQQAGHDLMAKEASLVRVQAEIGIAKRNLAFAKTEAQHSAVAEVFEDLVLQKTALEADIRSAKALTMPASSPEAEVNAALAVLGRLPQLVADRQNLTAIGEALRLVNVQLFLGFQPIQVKNRILNKVVRGVVTFGSAPTPVVLYQGPTGRRPIDGKPAAVDAASPEGGVPLPDQVDSGREGNSLGNVNRGDRI